MPSESRPLPIPGSLAVEFGGQSLLLLPDRAVYWPARRALIVADVHLGKGAAFRKAGLPVPTGSSVKDLARLKALLDATSARELIVLGDLIHARASHQPELFECICCWRETTRHIGLTLIRGNHDRAAGRAPIEWKVNEVDEPFEHAGLLLCHAPQEKLRLPVLAGHVHPVIAIQDFDRSMVRIPCFVFDHHGCGTLPSFGGFTGGFPVKAAPGRSIYITSGKKVVAHRRG